MSNSKYFIKAKVSSKKVIIDNVVHEDIKFWHSNNLLSFTEFLDEKYPEWCWYNVYDNHNKSLQIANYTKNKRPTHKFVVSYEKYMR